MIRLHKLENYQDGENGFIGIDIGTTNVKICLFSFPQFLCLYKYSFKTPIIIRDAESEFNINEIWDNIIKGLKEIPMEFKAKFSIKGISIASVGESGVLVNNDDETLGPAITWYDKRTKNQLEYIKDRINPKDIYKITGLPCHTNYSINKILWIRDNIDNKKYKNYKWLCIAEYFAYKFTGTMKSEFSLASRTMALDLEKKQWSNELLNRLDIDTNIFPDLVSAGQAVGKIKETIAKEISMSTDISIAIGGHDHMCGSIAAEMNSEEQVLNSTGTTEGLLVLQNKANTYEEFYNEALSKGIDTIDEYYTLFGSLPAAGYSVEWALKNFFGDDYGIDDLMKKINLDTVCENKLIYIPHLRGSGPPNRYVNAKGFLYGITEEHSKVDILKGVLEGLCYELKNLIDKIEELTKSDFNSVKVIGSACKNPVWLQMKADILNKRIISYKVDEAVAKGAAILMAFKTGYLKTIDNISSFEKIEIYEPNKERVKMYSDIFNNMYKPFYKYKLDLETKVIDQK